MYDLLDAYFLPTYLCCLNFHLFIVKAVNLHNSLCALQMFVEEVMSLVELLPLRNSQVGLPGAHGLSPEQRKRLTIAVELVSSPSIIFMDEPTTGLDARAAAIVMRTVRKTVDTGRTVVCTIHQPSIEIFESFDEVCSSFSCFHIIALYSEEKMAWSTLLLQSTKYRL